MILTYSVESNLLKLIAIVTLVSIAAIPLCSGQVTRNNSQLFENLSKLEPCVESIVYSWIYERAKLPTSIDELSKSCQTQSDGFKCIKERYKNTPAIVKRGLAGLMANRQRHHKKFCTNINSEVSKQFVDANKCIAHKRSDALRKVDAEFANSLVEIRRLNYNDSAIELNYICCSFMFWRKHNIDDFGQDCASSKPIYEETISSIMSRELELICDDDEKLSTKVCPKLTPLDINKPFQPRPGNSPSVLGLYLIATLGESE